MTSLQFTHTNIIMAHRENGDVIVWDRDTDTFGAGRDYPAALADLAGNYPDDYKADGGGE